MKRGGLSCTAMTRGRIPLTADMIAGCVVAAASRADVLARAVAWTRAWHQRTMLFEAFGLFWIFAELVILYCVLAGRRHLETQPIPDRISLSHKDRRRALVWIACFALGGFLERRAGSVPVSRAHAPGDLGCVRDPVGRARNRDRVSRLARLSAAAALDRNKGDSRMIATRQPFAARMLGAILILIALSLAASPAFAADDVETALWAAHRADAVHRNALYLYLRLAGVAWVTVEWIAAIVLWRAYRLLATARCRSAGP
jgi:hypothetical protein